MKKIIPILLCVAMIISLSSCAAVDEILSGLSKDKIDDSNRIISVANEDGERWYWLPTHMESFTPDGKPQYTYDITYAEDTYVLDTMKITVYDENGEVKVEQSAKLASYEEKDYITFWSYDVTITKAVKAEDTYQRDTGPSDSKSWFMLDLSTKKYKRLTDYKVAAGSGDITFDEAKAQLEEIHLATEWFMGGGSPLYQCYIPPRYENELGSFEMIQFPKDEFDITSFRMKPDTDHLEWTAKTASGETVDVILPNGFAAGLAQCDSTKDEISPVYYYDNGNIAEKATFVPVTGKAYLEYVMLDIDSYRTLSIDGMMFFMDPSACKDYFVDDFESGKYKEYCSYRDRYSTAAE